MFFVEFGRAKKRLWIRARSASIIGAALGLFEESKESANVDRLEAFSSASEIIEARVYYLNLSWTFNDGTFRPVLIENIFFMRVHAEFLKKVEKRLKKVT